MVRTLDDYRPIVGDAVLSEIFATARILEDKPLVTQVLRMDQWKDPEGLPEVFKHVREKVDCRPDARVGATLLLVQMT